ncbi:MAG: PD40 domain-containing protein [Bacteroidia bacterium]|nr:PD40 domain-containing protein [Bacteroidia bacterium]
MKKVLILILSAALCAFIFPGNEKEKKKWDVSNPPGTYTTAEFTTEEGTFMSVDVSPDGNDLVFDLLGDIYTMPAGGGEAKLLRGGHAFELQPVFSPDGQWICFTSDAGGGDNIWVMKKDGSGARQVTKENFRLLNSPVFSADGQYIIARKHFTSRRSLGAGELWMYHLSGGEGVQLTKRKNDQQDVGEPCVSSDGQYVYFSEDMYPGGYFQYNKDPNHQIYVVKRYNLKNGETETVTGGAGSAFRPQISKDGKTLAFLKRVRTKTVLFLRNLETGEEWPVYDDLTKDQIEAWAIFGTYPRFSWLSGKEVIIWSGGKFNRLDVTNGKSVNIPFKAKCSHRVYDALRFKQDPAPDQFTVKAIRHAVTSPDGKTLVFSAAGYLYKKELPNGKPERLTAGTDFEFEPAFSPGGGEIIFVTWNDEETGAICKLSLKEKKVTKLSKDKGIFRTPSFSPDGRSIVYWKEDGNDHQGTAYSLNPGIYTMSSGGGTGIRISKEGHTPSFTADGKRIYFHTEEGGGYAFSSSDLSGNEKRTHFTSAYSGIYSPSPDGKWVAFVELYKVYIAAIPPSGKTLPLSGGMHAAPVRQVARDAGINLHWSSDSKKLYWTLGEEYFTAPLDKNFSFLPGAPDSLPPMDTSGIKVGLQLKSDKPSGVIALKGARIITMKGDEVIENGTVVITDNKITAVGTSGTVQIPAGAKVIDVTGKTIMPGFVDVHAHIGNFRHGLSPQKQWSYFANLAYGVTTVHDPSSNTEMIFSQSEMVRAGNMTGPRIFSTGWILYGAEGDYKAVINSLDDARSHLRRTAAFGAFSVKSYNQPRREQRQQVITGARELGIMVVPEGGSTSWYNITQVMDGHTGVEHNLPFAPLYNDVVKLWAASKTHYTPTLIVSYGAINGENYWYQHTNVWEKERLLKFTPRAIIDSRSRHRTMIPEEEYENGYFLISRSCKKLADAGVKVNLGAHGQLQGLGVHWELWMLQQGGMSNMQALRCATLNGAEYIGMDQYIGTIETGKLADLIILEKNPLDNIRNSESVKYTMVNGRLFDCDTMDELGLRERTRGKFYWENPKWINGFPWHENGHGHGDDD